MINKVIKAIEKYNMLQGVSHITVALSGGADSMVLLYVLNELKGRFGFELSAAHLNHGIRGAEADHDEEFVTLSCKKLNIPLICEKRDIPSLAAASGQSVELAARNERYAFLKSVSKGAIATAHTASDNAETVLFNLARGTSLKGLCGIPKTRGNIIRPLIYCTRSEIEEYCRQNAINYCIDSTNSDVKYTRNRLRHNVLPELRLINPALDEKLANTCELLSQDEELLSQIALNEFNNRLCGDELNIIGYNELHISVARRVLALFLTQATESDIDAHLICDLNAVCINGGRCDLNNGFYAVASGGKLKAFDSKTIANSTELNCLVNTDDYTSDCEFIVFEPLNIKDFKNVNKKLLINAIDCDKIIGNLVIRKRTAGDSIELCGRKCRKSLKKLFIEYKIPSFERESIVVLADDNGVVWVEGFGVDERVKINERTLNAKVIKSLKGGEI